MINQKFKISFQISQPANIPQKCFSTQNGPLDDWFQMRLSPNHAGFFVFGKIKQNPQNNLLNCLFDNIALLQAAFYFPNIRFVDVHPPKWR